MKAMLDTSVLIGRIPDDIVEHIEEHAASVIVRAELVRGLERFEATPGTAHQARERAQLVNALDALPTFWRSFGVPESDAYARLRARPEQAARSKDALIAGHAAAHGVPLVTADRGFTRFVGIDVRFVE